MQNLSKVWQVRAFDDSAPQRGLNLGCLAPGFLGLAGLYLQRGNPEQDLKSPNLLVRKSTTPCLQTGQRSSWIGCPFISVTVTTPPFTNSVRNGEFLADAVNIATDLRARVKAT